MAPKQDCLICANSVDSCRFIGCPSCNFEVCFGCVDKFVKATNGDVSCMSCKHVWDRAFIYRTLPPSLVFSTIKDKRQNILFDIEKAMLPHTMPLIPLEEEIGKLTHEKRELVEEINKLKNELDSVNIRLNENKRKKAIIIMGLNMQNGAGASTSKKEVKKPVNETICSCPKGDCRGFITKSDMKCGLCSTKICKKCRVVIEEGSEETHVCNEDDVASVQIIKKECKACPGCGVQSRKTEGCSQVWCMMCKTAWNWNTQEIEHGNIHATDYLNFMRNKGNAIAPVCGQYINPATYFEIFKNKYTDTFNADDQDFIWGQFRIVEEYGGRMNRMIEEPDNLDLRIRYLKKEIDEKQWKSLLHKRDKDVLFKTEIHRMRVAYTQVMRDAITVFCNSKTEAELVSSLDYCRQVHTMMSEEYGKLAKCFNSKRKSPFIK